MRSGLALLLGCALLGAHGARPCALGAQALAEIGTTRAGLAGLDRIHLPRAPAPQVSLAASAGYGFIESQGDASGAHHRALGTLGVGAALSEGFGLALRFDGRHDVHPDDGMGADSGTVGDPRLLLRGGLALSDRVQLGGEAALWLPGENAPSFRLSAASVDARATVAYAAPESAWTFAGTAGYRIDRSAASAPDVQRLRDGDRLSLGLSDFNAVLLGAGVLHRAGALELLSELSWDVLVGGGAPGAFASPLRLALGARYHLGALQLGVLASVSPSERPAQGASDPLVPIEPRFALETGIAYRFGARPLPNQTQPEAELAAPDETAAPERVNGAPSAPASADVRGRLLDEDGEPIAGARVRLRPGAGGAELEGVTDAQGGYAFEAVPLGPATLRAEREGYAELRWDVQVAPAADALDQVLARAPSGQLRGLAQSFGGRPVAARIRVHALGDREGEPLELEAGANGRFQLEVAPGRYEVRVTAAGFEAQVRAIEVAADQVLILNLDLRKVAP